MNLAWVLSGEWWIYGGVLLEFLFFDLSDAFFDSCGGFGLLEGVEGFQVELEGGEVVRVAGEGGAAGFGGFDGTVVFELEGGDAEFEWVGEGRWH